MCSTIWTLQILKLSTSLIGVSLIELNNNCLMEVKSMSDYEKILDSHRLVHGCYKIVAHLNYAP